MSRHISHLKNPYGLSQEAAASTEVKSKKPGSKISQYHFSFCLSPQANYCPQRMPIGDRAKDVTP
jgi:hypothetical protein